MHQAKDRGAENARLEKARLLNAGLGNARTDWLWKAIKPKQPTHFQTLI